MSAEDEQSLHQRMAEAYAEQQQNGLTASPAAKTGFYNRNHVQAKLTDELYARTYSYCKQNQLNFNSFTRLAFTFFLDSND